MAGSERCDAAPAAFAVQRHNPSLIAEESWESIERLAGSPVVHAAAGGGGLGGSPAGRARPITPDPTPVHASTTPGKCHPADAAGHTVCRAEAGAAPGAAAAVVDEAAERGRGSPGGEGAGWRRVHSFVCCVTASPAIQSALLSLLLSAGAEDLEAAAGNDGAALPPLPNLRLTLSQLLALFLRAGYDQASEEVLLAALWLLESVGSAWRSPASLCLGAYLKHVALFCPELASRLTATWPASFVKLRSVVVAAQKDLLARLSWRVRPDLQNDVRPCHHWLFRDPCGWAALAAELGAEVAAGADAAAPLAAPPAAAWDAWSSHMAALCARLQQRASLARVPASPVRAERAEVAQNDPREPLARPTPEGLPKRQRTQL